MKLKLTVEVSYSPQEFYNHMLTQAHWTAETYDVPGANQVYGMDAHTSQGAIEDLISQLKAKGLNGTLVLVHTHSDDEQEQMDEQARQALANDRLYWWYGG